MSELELNSHKRNRQIVKEIINTCKDFRDQVTKHFEQLREDYEAD